jgi:hypothetical protein
MATIMHRLGRIHQPLGRTLAAAAIAAALFLGTAHAATMKCAPSQVIATVYPSGATYTAAADGLVTNVAGNDVLPLTQAGCQTVGMAGLTVVAILRGANMNATTDQTMTVLIPANDYYIPSAAIAENCSVSLTTAAGSFYSAASKGGSVVMGSGATQAFSGCTATGLTDQLIAATAAQGNLHLPASTPPILSLTTAQGAAATADVYLYGYVVGQ